MDPKLKTALLNIDVGWSECSYSDRSRRIAVRTFPSTDGPIHGIAELLQPLDGWDELPEIAVDGMNGTGKSTLINSMNRHYLKVNELAPNVTNGSSYNYDVFKSIQYLTLPQMTECENVCWDRCCYSNLIFYFVHQLMFYYRDEVIPKEPEEVYLYMNNLAISVNLLQTVAFIESMKPSHVVFIVCSDLNLIGESLRNRECPNDVYNSKEHNYQMAQYHAYKYFGELLKMPTFDLAEVFRLGINLGEFHYLLKRKIDTKVSDYRVTPPCITEAVELNKMLDEQFAEETLLYDYSNK